LVFARSLRDIVQLPKQKRLAVIAEGVDLLASSVATLETDAASLAESRRFQSAAVLRCFADEEAAKVLIMLDVARAGWGDSEQTKRLLGRFYQHLARGLYVRAYGGNPADVAEVRRFVDMYRPSLFLDGPMDVDWIFGNEINAAREERLYVDYVRYEDHNGWVGPADRAATHDEPFQNPPPPSVAAQLVIEMHKIGLLTIAGFKAIQAVWDGRTVDDDLHWSDVWPLNVEIVNQLGIPNTDENRLAAQFVVDRWIFPLCTLDLDLIDVKMADLRQERDRRLATEAGW
jgi:AbiV family abortive infection protein